MAATDHRGDMLFAGWAIRWLIRKRTDPPLARKGQRGFGRAIGDGRGDGGAVILTDPGVTERPRHTTPPQATTGHRACSRLAKCAIIDIAGRSEPIGDHRRIGRCTIEPALPDFAVQIGRQLDACCRESLDITQGKPLKTGTVERRRRTFDRAHAIIVPQSGSILNACSGDIAGFIAATAHHGVIKGIGHGYGNGAN